MHILQLLGAESCTKIVRRFFKPARRPCEAVLILLWPELCRQALKSVVRSHMLKHFSI